MRGAVNVEASREKRRCVRSREEGGSWEVLEKVVEVMGYWPETDRGMGGRMWLWDGGRKKEEEVGLQGETVAVCVGD